MLGYRRFLLENSSEESIKHVVTKDITVNGYSFIEGEVYYTDAKGLFHRLDGPAIIANYGGFQEWRIHGKLHRLDGPAQIRPLNQKQWWIDGGLVAKNSAYYMTDEDKWALLKASIPNNLEILNFIKMDKEMQEYICKIRPDLIGEIKDLDPELEAKYKHETGLSKVDL